LSLIIRMEGNRKEIKQQIQNCFITKFGDSCIEGVSGKEVIVTFGEIVLLMINYPILKTT